MRDLTKSSLFDELDNGEAEVLMLAIEQNADFVIIDEALGQKYAVSLGIKITGTIGILLRAKQLGLINNVSNLLDILKDQGTWLSPKLLEKVREIADE